MRSFTNFVLFFHMPQINISAWIFGLFLILIPKRGLFQIWGEDLTFFLILYLLSLRRFRQTWNFTSFVRNSFTAVTTFAPQFRFSQLLEPLRHVFNFIVAVASFQDICTLIFSGVIFLLLSFFLNSTILIFVFVFLHLCLYLC